MSFFPAYCQILPMGQCLQGGPTDAPGATSNLHGFHSLLSVRSLGISQLRRRSVPEGLSRCSFQAKESQLQIPQEKGRGGNILIGYRKVGKRKAVAWEWCAGGLASGLVLLHLPARLCSSRCAEVCALIFSPVSEHIFHYFLSCLCKTELRIDLDTCIL